ncbi:general stress protein [Bacillus sp. FJAT-50079]|uniref:general stress protein n=1 Tax=Bacillus sp. FJAT-50079 TaxID=2833577 RepID=UPI001BC8DA5B|nr:general stress protein [Bacillus sp. FJAT-50079]MBS4208049.1 general stress protein [Bacillus sp. FJAT-50079]
MADKIFVGTFQSQNQVLNKINELKRQGYSEEDMYVVADHADSLSIVRGRTDVTVKDSEGNWLNRFVAFLSGDEPVKGAFKQMGFTEEESSRFYSEMKRGNILLYVNENFTNVFLNDGNAESENRDIDPNLASYVPFVGSDSPSRGQEGGNIEPEDEVHFNLPDINNKDHVQNKHTVEDE